MSSVRSPNPKVAPNRAPCDSDTEQQGFLGSNVVQHLTVLDLVPPMVSPFFKIQGENPRPSGKGYFPMNAPTFRPHMGSVRDGVLAYP